MVTHVFAMQTLYSS